MVSSRWAFLAFPFQGMPSVWGWYIPNLSELMAPQLHGSQPIWLPSSCQSSLRFCRDILWFSQKRFLKILFFFQKQLHFFTPKGFFFLLPTWNTILSECVSDWVKPLQFLLHCGTPGPEKELSWSLYVSWMVCEIMEQGSSLPEFTGLQLSHNMTFTDKWHLVIQHVIQHQLTHIMLA